ncbi:hypothetical protein [Kitasatospora sp. NPDC094011]|uniref:hypothetical protein n=1 Tax=Kitasatospora sp. NPDC094011 TaxID=3364090 RepID=UPI0037FBEC75
MRLAYLLRDLPVEILGRLRSDRVMRRPSTAASSSSRTPGPGAPRTWRRRRRPTATAVPMPRAGTGSIPSCKDAPPGGTTPAG